jgi:hypothetical protein
MLKRFKICARAGENFWVVSYTYKRRFAAGFCPFYTKVSVSAIKYIKEMAFTLKIPDT